MDLFEVGVFGVLEVVLLVGLVRVSFVDIGGFRVWGVVECLVNGVG